ncbi:MAG: hypothetical protein JNJ57_21230, partial [Saprospiraceae bacterium]|nr:hypothetical protein [Saprospiraceae bacterium]
MSMPGCLLVNAFQAPDTPLVTGIQIVCLDSSAVYSVDSVPGALYYLWEVTNGLLLNNDSSRNVQVLWNSNSGSGSICATAVNNCGESQPHCISVDIPTPPPFPGLISGNSSPCSGVPISYSITTVGTATGYLWTVPAGASILSGQNTANIQIDWGAINGGQVCVQALNDCGASQPQCLNVQVSAQPAANAGPDTQVCSLLASFNAQFSVSGSTGIWTEVTNNGGVLYADEISPNSTVEVSAPGLYLFQWTETNGNCSDSDTIAITFHEIPTSGTIQPICDANNQNYTVEFPILSGTAPFTVAGGMVTNGVFTSNPIPNGQSYQFQISDANGCLSSLISGVFNCNCSTNAGQMQQSTLEVCEGGTASAIPAQNTVFDGDDIGAYFLHSGSGSVLGTIFSQNQTGVFSFQNGMAFETTYYISFVVGNNVNGAPDLQDPCLSVAPGQPVIFHENPPTNAGVDQAVCALVLTVNGSPGNGLENWSVVGTPPGGSLVITSPQNITTDVTATLPGTYLLQLSVTVNGCTTLDTVQLTFGAPPIANNIVAICDPTNTTYTLTFQITGAGAPFSVNGQTIPGNNFSSAPINEGDTYNFVITDANGCISSPITGNHTCNCSTNAGAVSLTPIMLCPTDSAQVQLTSNPTLDGDDVAGFVLHTGSGTTLGAIIAQSLTGKFGFSPGMFYGVTYYVSAIAGNNSNGFPDINDPCLSLSAGQPVTFLEAPVPNAGADLGVCGLTAFLDASFGLFPGTWTLVSGPGTASIANSTNPKSSVTVSALGTYVFRWTEANGACLVFDEVTANFFPSPVIGLVTETCNATNTAYVISFTVSGGAQPYTVNGIAGSFTGNTFTSVEIPNNGAYAVSLIDLNGCPAPVASGSFMCFCATIAGTMDPNPLVFCEDQAATAVWNNDATLDGDDGIMFILHNLSGPLAGTVYGVSNQPSFTLLPGMATGTTYYISAVAGNLNSGTVDLNDPCLNVSLGTPVQWKALPEAFLSGDATICNGSSTVLSFNGTGTFPLTVNYTDGALNFVVNITGPLSTTISVNPSQSTTYSITSITDGTLPACSNTFNESVTVTVNQPVNAGTDGLPVELCAGNAQTIQLGTLITGEDAGGTWAETSAFPSGAGAFNASSGAFNPSNQAPGLYIFRYTVTAALTCPNQTSMASVEIHPVPIADAGPDALINCQTNSVTLGGPTTSAGAGLAYEWTSGNTPVGNSIQHTTSQSGTYQLSVTNAFGCTDTDEVVVVLD